MISDADVWAAALLIVKRYGDDAMLKSVQRADPLLDECDMAGAGMASDPERNRAAAGEGASGGSRCIEAAAIRMPPEQRLGGIAHNRRHVLPIPSNAKHASRTARACRDKRPSFSISRFEQLYQPAVLILPDLRPLVMKSCLQVNDHLGVILTPLHLLRRDRTCQESDGADTH
jgi:hypothetical protein